MCVLAAMVFWFFNALNKNYTTSISFPLAFDYDRVNFISIRPLPATVRINVTGIGWNLFRRSVGLKVPALVIPLDKPAEVKKIVGSTLPAFFANQLADFQINFVITDTLHVAIEPVAGRKLRISVDVPSVLLKKGYALVSDIEVVPDSVSLEGPQMLIAELSDPLRLRVPQRDIDETFDESLEVSFMNDELIRRNPASVVVKFQVDRLVEVSDSVRLEIIHAPEQARAVIKRAMLAVTLAIPESAMPNYQIDSVRAVIDLADFTKGERKVLPQLKGLPPYSQITKIDSVYIKF